MRRLVMIVSLLVLWGGWAGVGRLARAEEASNVLIPQASLDDIAKKLDSIRTYQEHLKDLSARLDHILQNQETILAELYVIKIRTSRR